ncbi:MAG: Phosphate-specific transport system accessory protein PhoU [Myxococcota bacterium]|nr:Phosphate-specific transport system accessory protein PhoU [Myxococcota bacterium]
MAGRVEEMIANSAKALSDRDLDLARRTIDLDKQVNRDEVETDELCIVIVARRQPMASDLRMVTLCMKMVTDLERIGDLAVNICERVLDMRMDPDYRPSDGLVEMANLVQIMVRDAIDSFVHRNAEKAREVIARDDQVDEIYHNTFRYYVENMRQDPNNVERGIHMISVSKVLERMADHATNLAEQVVFMVDGTDIRHAGKLQG